MSKALDLFVMCAPGLEGLLGKELRGIGVRRGKAGTGGIELRGTIDDVQRINLWSRIANRVLVRVTEFHASSFHELERRAKRVAWESFVAPGSPARFRVTAKKSKLYHSDAVAERLAKATGVETAKIDGDDDDEDGAQLFVVRLAHDACTISIDSSGELLHRRGYRQAVAKAPLRETLAAATIAGCGWEPSSPLVDPLCGSGTIAIEAAMLSRNIAPGMRRSFAFERWPGHDAAAWTALLDDARLRMRDAATAPIIASDRDAGAVEATMANADRAGVAGDIEISSRAMSAANYPQPPGWIVTNPPYGTRVGESRLLRNLYAQMGKVVRAGAPGYRIAFLSADKRLDAQVGVELREVFQTTNGGIKVRLVAS